MGKTTKHHFQSTGELTEEEREAIRLLGEQEEKERAERLRKEAEEREQRLKSIDFMNAQFEPFEDRVLVYPDPVEERTQGGLYKPDAVLNKSRPLIGTVVQVGPGKVGVGNLHINPSDRVYYGNYAGTEITLNEIKYLIMRFADIFGRAK